MQGNPVCKQACNFSLVNFVNSYLYLNNLSKFHF